MVIAWPAIYRLARIPDLPPSEAATIIRRTPEFIGRARLLSIEQVIHLKDLTDSVSYGLFTFVHLNPRSEAGPIKGWADFRYRDGEWRLNQFDFGCDHSALYPAIGRPTAKEWMCTILRQSKPRRLARDFRRPAHFF